MFRSVSNWSVVIVRLKSILSLDSIRMAAKQLGYMLITTSFPSTGDNFKIWKIAFHMMDDWDCIALKSNELACYGMIIKTSKLKSLAISNSHVKQMKMIKKYILFTLMTKFCKTCSDLVKSPDFKMSTSICSMITVINLMSPKSEWCTIESTCDSLIGQS